LAGSQRSNLLPELGKHLVEALRRLPAAALADGERAVRLAVAVDDDVGQLLELRVADPLAERLVALLH
jgi:hypothetical protein